MIALLMLAATFQTGNQLYERCNNSSEVDRGFCIGYAAGVADMLTIQELVGERPKRLCVPVEVTGGQLSDVVVKGLRDDPASRNQTASGLAAISIIEAFPCPVATPKRPAP